MISSGGPAPLSAGRDRLRGLIESLPREALPALAGFTDKTNPIVSDSPDAYSAVAGSAVDLDALYYSLQEAVVQELRTLFRDNSSAEAFSSGGAPARGNVANARRLELAPSSL